MSVLIKFVSGSVICVRLRKQTQFLQSAASDGDVLKSQPDHNHSSSHSSPTLNQTALEMLSFTAEPFPQFDRENFIYVT